MVSLAGPGKVPLAIVLIVFIVLGIMNDYNKRHKCGKP